MTSIKVNLYCSRLVLLLVCILAVTGVSAQTVDKSDPSPLKFPTPKGIKNQLFYLQRDPNTNTVIYELNVDERGQLDREEPVIAYWLRYAEKGEKKDLNFIQRKFAYGIHAKETGKDQYELRLASQKKLPMYLQLSETDHKFHVYVTVNNKKVQVERIFARIEGGSFWIPDVHYVEIKGLHGDVPVTERIKIKKEKD